MSEPTDTFLRNTGMTAETFVLGIAIIVAIVIIFWMIVTISRSKRSKRP